MNIQLSDNLPRLVAEVARKLVDNNTVRLPKPWSGFYVSLYPPERHANLFKTYFATELGLSPERWPSGRDRIFLICTNVFGGENDTEKPSD